MPQFLLPAFLIGLSGIVIPVLVHLWNTRDSRVIKVGSIRWIQESASVKVSRIRLSEIALLLLRIVIISLLVLLLADMRSDFFKAETTDVNWLLVDPAIEDLTGFNDTIEVMKERGWEIRLLQPTFPLLDDRVQFNDNENFWKLLKELDLEAVKPDSVMVFSRSMGSNFKGVRPELGIAVRWVTVPSQADELRPVLALSLSDSLLLFYAKPEGLNIILKPGQHQYKLTKEEGSSYVNFPDFPQYKIVVNALDSLQILVSGDEESDHFKNLLASIQAVNAMTLLPLGINKNVEAEVVFNLTDSIKNGTLLTLINRKDQKLNGMLFNDVTDISTYYITKNLSIDQMMKYDFVKELYDLFTQKFQNEIRSNARIELSVATVQPQWAQPTANSGSTELSALTTPLWLLLIALLAVERIISHRKNQ